MGADIHTVHLDRNGRVKRLCRVIRAEASQRDRRAAWCGVHAVNDHAGHATFEVFQVPTISILEFIRCNHADRMRCPLHGFFLVANHRCLVRERGR